MFADIINKFMPAFQNDEQNRKANVLLLSSIIIFLGAIGGLLIFIVRYDFNLILIFIFMLIGAAASISLLNQGHANLASWIFLLWLLATIFMVLYTADGIHDMMILLLPITVTMASMLFGKRGMTAYSLIVFISIETFIICEMNGTITNRMSHFTSALDLISVGILMFISIVLTYKMSVNMKHSFLMASQSNNSLAESNLKLKYEMKERIIIENALKTKVSELEQYKKMTVDRELKMMELKKEINRLNLGKGGVNETS